MALNPERSEREVLCFGARGSLDDAAALVAAQLLERRGFGAQALSWIDLTPANLPLVKTEGARLVCLFYLNDNSIAHARYLVRRMRRHIPKIQMHVVFLGAAADQTDDTKARDATKADFVSTSLSDALDQITAPEPPTDAVIVEKVTRGEVLPFPDPISKDPPRALAPGT